VRLAAGFYRAGDVIQMSVPLETLAAIPFLAIAQPEKYAPERKLFLPAGSYQKIRTSRMGGWSIACPSPATGR